VLLFNACLSAAEQRIAAHLTESIQRLLVGRHGGSVSFLGRFRARESPW
jgi:hypothetical protein